MVPNYYKLWAEFYGADKFGGPCDAESLAKLEAEHGAFTEEEIQRALNGDDGIDPISSWNFDGAPKPLFDLAQEHERRMLDDKVRRWIDDEVSQEDTVMESEGEEDGGAMVSEVGDLDVDDFAFGEEACKEA